MQINMRAILNGNNVDLFKPYYLRWKLKQDSILWAEEPIVAYILLPNFRIGDWIIDNYRVQ